MILDRLTSDDNGTIDVTDPGDIGDFLTTGGIPEGANVNTGTPPLIGPGGSVLGGLSLRSRLAGAAGFEALRSDTGTDVTQDLTGDIGTDGPDSDSTRTVKTVGIFLAVLGVIVAVGQLFTVELGS